MNDFIKVFSDTLLGDTLFAELAAYLVLALIGATLYMRIRINNRMKSDNGKPEKWSWRFFLKDNFDRLVITFLLVFIWASHGHTLDAEIQKIAPWLGEIGKGIYIVIGFFTDLIVVYLKQAYQFVIEWIKTKFSKSETQN